MYKDIPDNCFTREGWFDIEPLISPEYPLLFVVGGRGFGKTYSTLKYVINAIKGTDYRFAFLRRTEDEIKALCSLDELDDPDKSESPFKNLWENGVCPMIKARREKASRYTFNIVEDWNQEKEEDSFIGHIISLSSFAKVKGAGFSRVKYIVMDEFIPMAGARNVRNEGFYLQNTYETLSMQRQTPDGENTYLICLANATTLSNPTFLEWGLINDIHGLVDSGKKMLDLPERHIRVVILPDNGMFTQRKSKSILYESLPTTSRMYRSSISNEFYGDDFSDVQKRKKGQVKPYAIMTAFSGKCYTVYKETGGWYMEEGVSGRLPKNVYNWNLMRTADREQCKAYLFADTWFDYRDGKLTFDSYETKCVYFDAINKKMVAD